MPSPQQTIVVALLLCLSIAGVTAQADIQVDDSVPDPQYLPSFPDFDTYIQQFNKTYEKGSVEYVLRKGYYEKRVDYWRSMYMAGELTYLVGATERSDWSEEQRSESKPLKMEDLVEESRKGSAPIKVTQTAGNPVSLDWRNKNIITSIKNQGSCGSCWTFATNAYGESRMIQRGQADLSIDLSEQYLLSCTPQCSCSGGYLEYVFEQAANGGVPTESSYPYNPKGLVSPFICWATDKKVFGYIVKKAYDLSQSELQSLLQKGPVAISISATDWEDYKGGIFKCYPTDKVNHAVLLIGYDQSSWLIKNQWGTKWGENGFIRVSKNRLSNCKIGSSAFWMWESSHNLMVGVLLVLSLLML